MLVRVLGDVELGVDGGPVPVGSRSQRVVLAVLAARPRVAVSADLLVDALWGDDPPRSAPGSLRTYVSRLRRSLGDVLAIGPAGYVLDVPPEEIDAERFEQLVDRAATSPPAVAVDLLDEALSLWRGPAFGDVAGVEAVRGAAVRLEERRVAAREARAAGLLAAGRPADAVGAAEELVAEHPLREGAWAVLVEALTSVARLPEALRAYQRAATVLADAGLEPSDRLRRAEAAALTHREPDLAHRPLAVATSPLVGREGDLSALAELLDHRRVVTLVGPGGVGKSRLALAVATSIADRFEWGARFVELAGVSDPDAVLDAVADGLGLAVEAGAPERALARAGRLDLLAVLDNCEHLPDAAARAVEVLCGGGTGVRVLATSREALGVQGEHRWPVAPLPSGTPGTAAFELFLERARAVRPDLDPDDGERAAIEQIVHRLDGLPLAIEMAATRAATMPLAELARRLERELSVLVSGRRTVEPRHRTLDAVVEWSERLLDEEERALFADMAVFEGAVRPDDVAAVTGHPDPLEVLCRLAEGSLLVAHTSGSHGRFGMLRTIRDRAAHLLAERGRVGELTRRHARHVAGALAEADRDLRGPGESEARARIEELLDEARSAQAWAARHDLALALRLCGSLYLFGQSGLRDELLGWSAGLADRVDESGGRDGALVLTAAAQRAVNAGDLPAALDLARRAVALSDDGGTRALACELVSDVHLFSGRLDDARSSARAGLAAAEEAGDAHGVVASLVNLALVASYGGDHAGAQRVLAAAPADPALSPSDRAWLRYSEGEVVLDRDPDRALAALDDAATLAGAVGNRYLSGVARVSATSLRARVGDPEPALRSFVEVIEHWRGRGDQPHQLTTLRNLVVLLQRLDAAPEVAELLGAVEGGEVAPTFGEEAARLDSARTWVVERLGAGEADRRAGTGRARTVDEAAEAALGWIATLRG